MNVPSTPDKPCCLTHPVTEGQARNTTGEFVQFLSHAEGSAAELDIQLRLSVDLGYCHLTDLSEVFRLLAKGHLKDAKSFETLTNHETLNPNPYAQ